MGTHWSGTSFFYSLFILITWVSSFFRSLWTLAMMGITERRALRAFCFHNDGLEFAWNRDVCTGPGRAGPGKDFGCWDGRARRDMDFMPGSDMIPSRRECTVYFGKQDSEFLFSFLFPEVILLRRKRRVIMTRFSNACRECMMKRSTGWLNWPNSPFLKRLNRVQINSPRHQQQT